MLRVNFIKDNCIYLTGDKHLRSNTKCLSKTQGDCTLFIKNTNVEGLFFYGAEQNVDCRGGHEKGYIWTSRASVMNKAFDIALIEAAYKEEDNPTICWTSCAIDLAHLEGLLQDTEYSIDWTPYVEGEADISYYVKKKS